jgi:hypothetical protein
MVSSSSAASFQAGPNHLSPRPYLKRVCEGIVPGSTFFHNRSGLRPELEAAGGNLSLKARGVELGGSSGGERSSSARRISSAQFMHEAGIVGGIARGRGARPWLPHSWG